MQPFVVAADLIFISLIFAVMLTVMIRMVSSKLKGSESSEAFGSIVLRFFRAWWYVHNAAEKLRFKLENRS